MENALKMLLDTLDEIARDHGDIEDTDVREQMRDAVEKSLLAPVAGYVWPDEFGMFEPDGNVRVKAALLEFVAAATVETAGLATRADRLRAFQNEELMSRDGSYYDDYFGYDGSLGDD